VLRPAANATPPIATAAAITRMTLSKPPDRAVFEVRVAAAVGGDETTGAVGTAEASIAGS
jgi:hypothetical protein